MCKQVEVIYYSLYTPKIYSSLLEVYFSQPKIGCIHINKWREEALFIQSNMKYMKKLTLLLFSFRLFCLVIFIYQAWNSFDDYSEKRTLSDIGFTKQDKVPLPSICITTRKFSHVSFNSTFNITYGEYSDGKWKASGLSERELWESVSPKLPNLIEKIKFSKKIENDTERAEQIKISVEDLNNSSSGVDIERKDYYMNPRIFCLTPRNLI